MKTHYVTSKTLGFCPASVDMATGEIDVNVSVWNRYTPFEQRFILEHENGHFHLQTDSETEADRYAIRKVAGTEPRSLKKAIRTLYKVGILDDSRLESLYKAALLIDYQNNGNPKALDELKKYGKITPKMRRKSITNTSSNPFINTTNRMDGDAATAPFEARYAPYPPSYSNRDRGINWLREVQTTVIPGTRQTQSTTVVRGVQLGEVGVTFTEIILCAMMVFLVKKLV